MGRAAAEGLDRLYETARALGEETRFRIYRRIWLSPLPEGVAELAAAFSLHPNAVRQHLTRLEQAGLIVSALERPGGAGRPRRVYAPSPEPFELGPDAAMRPLVSLMAEAVDALPGDRRKLTRFGEDWARSWTSKRKRGNGRAPRDPRARAELLSRELARWGWRPSAINENGGMRITTGRCLFHGGAPGENGRSCSLEEGLLRGLTEAMLNGRAASMQVRGCRLEVRV